LLQRIKRAFPRLKEYATEKGHTMIDNQRRATSSFFVVHGVPPGLVHDPFAYVEANLAAH
jgi:hypothetical protein